MPVQIERAFTSTLTRRGFVKAGGALMVSFAMPLFPPRILPRPSRRPFRSRRGLRFVMTIRFLCGRGGLRLAPA